MENSKSHSYPLKVAASIAILLTIFGIFARFDRLGSRLYWADEVVTSLRVSGYTMDDVKTKLLDGHHHTVAESLAYQTPGEHATPGNIVRSLAVEDAQHPPLYYLLERAWIGAFGNDIATRRSLSTLFSVIALPALYWLCLELFASPLIGCIAVGLAAVSPFFEIYARQAREYSLWELLTICSGAAVVRAARRPNDGIWWGISFLTLVLSAYTFLFGIFNAIAAGAYVGFHEKWRRTETLCIGLGVALLAGASFIPWLIQIIGHRDRIAEANAWSSLSWPLTYLIAKLSLNIASPFYDVALFNLHAAILTLPIFALIGISLVYFFRRASRDAKIYILSLLLPIVLFVIAPDVLTHAHRSSVTRYLLPVFIALQVVMAYFLAGLCTTRKWRVTGSLSGVVLIVLELQATLLQMRTDIWWDNQSAWPIPTIAAQIRQSAGTIVVATDWPTLLALSPYLRENDRLLLGNVPTRSLTSGSYLISPPPEFYDRITRSGIKLQAFQMHSPLLNSAHNVGNKQLGTTQTSLTEDHAMLFRIVSQ